MALITLGDRRLEVERIQAGEPGRPPLVFLHEGLGSLSMWKDFPERCTARAGCDAVVYSRLGYGASDPIRWPRQPDFMHREALEVLPRLLDALVVERPVLVGHSDGGSIALICAGSRVRPLSGVVSIAAHVIVEDVTVESIAAARRAFEEGDLRARLARHHADVDATFRSWSDVWLRPDFRRWSIEGLLPRIACPVLAIQGEDDEYGTRAQLDRIAAAVPDVEVLELRGCRHSPHRDQPEAVLDAIRAFVDRIAEARP